jgi:signal transduction histidine kinase/ligand-binding sensor domain-containing protein
MQHHGVAALAITCLVMGAGHGFAQSARVRVDRYTVDDGLAQDFVTGAVQDRTGFLWIGTRQGLQRFDGRTFVDFANLAEAGEAARELSGRILALILDDQGHIWAATDSALFRVDPVTRRTVRIPRAGAPRAWVLASANRLWYVDGDLLKWVDTRAVVPIGAVAADLNQRFGSGGWHGVIVALAESRGGGLWLASYTGFVSIVMRLNSRMQRDAIDSVPGAGQPQGLLEDRSGRVWLSTETGLAVLDQGGRTFRPLESFRNQRTTRVVPDRNGGVIVATDAWLSRATADGRVLDRWSLSPALGGMGLVFDLSVDREGGYWISTLTKGLVRVGPERHTFAFYSSRSDPPLPFLDDVVMAVFEQTDGALWVGTLSGGAYRLSPDRKRAAAFRREPGRIGRNTVWAIAGDHAGKIWIATDAGLCTLEIERLRCIYRDHGSALSLAADPSGWFWVVTSRSVVSFDPEHERIGDSLPASINAIGPSAVYADSDSSTLWLMGKGVMRAPVERGRIVGPPRAVGDAPEAFVTYALHRGRNGRMWRGTEAGLQVLDSSGGKFVPVDISEIGHATVYSIAEDSAGRLWLGTARGLVFYSPSSGLARHYGRREGFLSGELNRRAALRGRDGELVFGGVDGVTQFDPRDITEPRDAAPVVLTRWRKFSSGGVLDFPIDGARRLRLEPNDHAFTIEFAALSFAQNADRRFRYQLAGAHPGWIETSEPVATFSRPRAGHYVLRIQTRVGADGNWTDPGLAIPLDVIPPFWNTPWFELLIALAVAALLITAHRLRIRRAVALDQLRLRIARDLHDDIGAGLSSIALMSDALRTRPDAGAAAEQTQLSKIGATARGMVADLRDIIWAIDPDRDRLDDVVTRMKDIATGLLPGVRLTFRVSPTHQLSTRIGMAERRELLLVYKEILHNIAKHARAAAVTIELVAHGHELSLIVADDGAGIGPTENGNGTGLKSLRERAARLGGELEVRSASGGGTAVELRMETTRTRRAESRESS